MNNELVLDSPSSCDRPGHSLRCIETLLNEINAATADLRQLSANLASATGFTYAATAAQLVRNAAEAVAQAAKEKAPRRTGALASSITVVFLTPLSAIVGPTKKYGVFQEFGTASRGEFGGVPYKILPVRASRLRFEVEGKVVFAKEVTHPGVPPHPFMRPAIQEQMGALQTFLGQSGINVITSGKAQ